jgi:hypothetical protein
MIWIVIVLVAALILSLGTIVKQEFQLEQAEMENDQLREALAIRAHRTRTSGTARPYTELYDSRTNAMTAAQIAKWGMEP